MFPGVSFNEVNLDAWKPLSQGHFSFTLRWIPLCMKGGNIRSPGSHKKSPGSPSLSFSFFCFLLYSDPTHNNSDCCSDTSETSNAPRLLWNESRLNYLTLFGQNEQLKKEEKNKAKYSKRAESNGWTRNADTLADCAGRGLRPCSVILHSPTAVLTWPAGLGLAPSAGRVGLQGENWNQRGTPGHFGFCINKFLWKWPHIFPAYIGIHWCFYNTDWLS